MSKLAHYAGQTIEYLFYALFFFVPLILWPYTSEVFEFNKMLFVYAVTILIGAAWIVKWIDAKKITLRRTPLDLPILLFLLSQILSTIFSIDTHTSLWGYYSRFHGGLISTLAYIVLYYALVTNIKPYAIRYMLYAILGSATLVSAYGVLEHFGIDRHLWVQDVQNRVFSTLGQPNWLSAYLVAILPLPIFLALQEKNKSLATGYSLLATLFFFTILFTKSQSGISATYLTLGLILVYLIGQKTKLIYPLALILLLAGAVYKWSFIEKVSPLGPPNLAQLVEADRANRVGGSDSMIIRQVVWQGAREVGLKNPLFGAGVETFGYSYYTVRPALHNLLSEWEFLYNKAHNEYLNFFANTGFVGLTTYLFLIVASLILLRQYPAFFFGYFSILVTNYFGFSVVPVALFFFLFPALVFVISTPLAATPEVTRNTQARNTPEVTRNAQVRNTPEVTRRGSSGASNDPNKLYISINYRLNKNLSIFLLLLATSYLLLIPYRQWQADLAYNRGKTALAANAVKTSLTNLEKATILSPNEALFRAQLAESQALAATVISAQLTALPATASANLIDSGQKMLFEFTSQAESNSQKAIDLNPNHTNLYKSKAKVELYLGTFDPKYNQKAIDTLLALTKISPTEAKVFYNLGLLYQSAGEKEKAQAALEKTLALKPDYDQASASLKALKN